MTTTIEPTEDQRMAAAHYYANGRELTPYIAAWVKTGEGCEGDNVDSLARLLAEREAALLALVQHTQMSSMARAADLDAARARIAELEAHLSRSNGLLLAGQVGTLLARIAELEAEQDDTVGCEGCGKRLPSLCAVSTEDPVYLCARCVSPMHMEREAAHLAHIKALRGDGAALLNCEHNNMREMRDQFVSTLIATAHYDVESERIAHAIVERLTGVKR